MTMRLPPCRPGALRRGAIASAALAALLGLPQLPASAQYYSFSGAVGGSPTNPFPSLDPSVPLFDASGISLGIGWAGGTGSFTALAGAHLIADGLGFGLGQGNGSGSITGAGTLATLVGGASRLEVGNWGTGSLVVSAGAVVDGATHASACLTSPYGCYSFIGNAAGSNATLTVTGSGSAVKMLGPFNVASAAVFTQASSGFDFGSPGADTYATINVLDGATLRTENTQVSLGPGGAAPTGNEHTYATVTIDGAGSQWIVTPDSLHSGSVASMTLASHPNATADVTVSGGGLLRIDGAASAGPNDYMQIGQSGKGTVTVTGAGSRLEMAGVNPVINVGRSATAVGSFSVLSGATASTLYLNVGRNGATGHLMIDGSDSQLTQSGVGTSASPGTATAAIGRDGGSGDVTVSGGGRWLLTDGGMDHSSGSSGSPAIQIGRGANSTGSLTITGAGSKVELVSTSLGLTPGAADNFNPFVGVGHDNPATTTGSLMVSGGGQLILSGNAVSTPTHARVTELAIGGRYGQAGAGIATVTGAGSAIIVQGYDGLIDVGRTAGGSGVLNVLDGAQVSSISLLAGEATTGTVHVDHATIALSGHRTDGTNLGAGLTIGRGNGGTGTLNLTNGAALTITPSVLAGGMSIGGDQFQAGGTGTLNVSGASQVTLTAAPGLARVHIGHDGSGTATFSGNSVLNVAGGQVAVAALAGSTGTLTLNSNSVVNASYVGVGATPGGPGGNGTLKVNDGGTVNTTTLEIGPHGLLTGDGGIVNAAGNVIVDGTILPGDAPGRITINGGVLAQAGATLAIGIQSTASGYLVGELVFGSGSTLDLSHLNIAFHFIGGTDPNSFVAAGKFNLDHFLETQAANGTVSGLSTTFANGVDWSQVLSHGSFSASADSYAVSVPTLQAGATGPLFLTAQAVPEPQTWALWLGGLALLAGLLRRRRVAPRSAHPTWAE